jgi:hypothetical protein
LHSTKWNKLATRTINLHKTIKGKHRQRQQTIGGTAWSVQKMLKRYLMYTGERSSISPRLSFSTLQLANMAIYMTFLLTF